YMRTFSRITTALPVSSLLLSLLFFFLSAPSPSDIYTLSLHDALPISPELVEQHDLVIDCTDNFAAKFLLNDVCVENGKPVIFSRDRKSTRLNSSHGSISYAVFCLKKKKKQKNKEIIVNKQSNTYTVVQ